MAISHLKQVRNGKLVRNIHFSPKNGHFSLVFHFSPVLGEKWIFLISFTKYAQNVKFSLLLSHEKKALFHA